jgi:hypothetical protein
MILLPELFAIAIFSASIFLIYKGIEIDHPVYAVIFNNLIFSLVGSTVRNAYIFFRKLQLIFLK